jgi:hypothetical protein
MKIKFIIPLSLIGLMFACGPSTKLEKSWADPSFNATTMKPFSKVLIVAPLKDAASQRTAEDKIAKQLKQGVGVPSYTYLAATDTNKMVVDEKLLKDGIDGVITMQLKDVEKSTSYVQGTSSGGYYGRYGYRGGYYGYGSYSPGYYTEDKTFMVETNLYSIKDNKLLWSGTTSSLNPTSFEKTMDQIIYTIKYELQKKGYIAK